MPNLVYELGRQKFLEGSINYLTDEIHAVLIDTDDYTADFENDEFFSDIPAAAVIASGTLLSKTSTNGIADAADLILVAVSGDVSEAIVIVKDTGSDASSPLIGFMDTASGLPATPNGGSITFQWDNALSGSQGGIYKL